MIKDEKIRCKLLFGPYHPPRTRRGKFLVCEWRGTVKVGDYSDGPIPWPVKWGTRNSLILCGDLVEAVKQESELAVAHQWGVGIKTVQKWRQALEVEVCNPGTQWLQHVQAVDNSPPSKMRRLTEAARAVTRKPKPRKWRRQMSQLVRLRIQRQGPLNPKHRLWTAQEDRVLGSKSDEELAAKLGRTAGAVRSRRLALGLDLRQPHFRSWTSADEKLLGTKPDTAVAQMLGRTERGVQLRRQSLGIACFHDAAAQRPWTSEEDQLLGTLPDRELAHHFGRTLATVQHRRHIKGIPNPAPLRRAWTPKEDQLLGKKPDEELARLLGRPVRAVERRRHLKGIPNPSPKRKFWTPEEVALLRNTPDEEIAVLLGCSVRTVAAKRARLKIPAPELASWQ